MDQINEEINELIKLEEETKQLEERLEEELKQLEEHKEQIIERLLEIDEQKKGVFSNIQAVFLPKKTEKATKA